MGLQGSVEVSQRQAVNADDADGALHTGERTYYVYDSSGQRTRKVTERQQTGTRMKERLYIGGFEIYREYDATSNTVTLERDSLHVMDNKQRIALVETRTQGTDLTPPQLIRYQFGNHLGSASLELDDLAQLVSYEEYYPYGSTSYQSGPNSAEVSLKRYRYTGMERDEESGLEYHGARYYAPWLGTWPTPDPGGLIDGLNVFAYAHNRPSCLIDSKGTDTDCFDEEHRRDNGTLYPECYVIVGTISVTPAKSPDQSAAPVSKPRAGSASGIGTPTPKGQKSSVAAGDSHKEPASGHGGSAPDGESLVKHAARGFLKGVAAGIALALLPIELPLGVVVAAIAFAFYSAIQSLRGRDLLNRPISTGQAVENFFSLLGGFAGGFLGSQIPTGGIGPGVGPTPALAGGNGGTLTVAVPSAPVAGVQGGVLGGIVMSSGPGEGGEGSGAGEGSGGSEGEGSGAGIPPDPGPNIKLLSKGEIKALEEAGHDIHELKGGKGASQYDLYKDSDGNIWVKRKGGGGEADYTGLNIKSL